MKPHLHLRILFFVGVALVITHVAHAFYDPTIGRWLSMDPIDDNKGNSPYAYCEGDPLNKIDPDGCTVRFADGTNRQAVLQMVAFDHQSKTFQPAWQQLVNSKTTYYVGAALPRTESGHLDLSLPFGEFQPVIPGTNNLHGLIVDPAFGLKYTDGTVYPALVFAHEVQHAVDFDNGTDDKYAAQLLDPHQAPFFAPNQEEARAQQFAFNVALDLGAYYTLEYPELDTPDPNGFISNYVGFAPVDSVNPPAPAKQSCSK